MTTVEKLEAAIEYLEDLQTPALSIRSHADRQRFGEWVILHRTIDAQRSILVRALNLAVAKRGQIGDAEIRLANAILGDDA